MLCPICQISQKTGMRIKSKDYLFPKKEFFVYEKCDYCSTWNIETIPQNLSDYYPKEYYSYQSARSIDEIPEHKHALADKLINQYELNETHTILDFGGGNADLLLALQNHGAGPADGHGLICYDPFTPYNSIPLKTIGKNYVKNFMQDIKIQDTLPTNMTFDLILLRDVLEHTINPIETLIQCKNLLKKNGKLHINNPNPESFTWELSPEHSALLDAPRHLHVMPYKAFEIMAIKTGLKIIDKVTYGNPYAAFDTIKHKYPDTKDKKMEAHIEQSCDGFAIIEQKMERGAQLELTLQK